MNSKMYNGTDSILVHPSNVEHMQAIGWTLNPPTERKSRKKATQEPVAATDTESPTEEI